MSAANPASPVRPGPRNDLTDVPGVAVGQAHDDAVATGVTVIMPTAPAVCGVDVRGGGPGARETDLLDPSTLVERIDALVLSGGSSYGLAAADGAAAWLGARGRGFSLLPGSAAPPSPIVPGAILYDLANGGDKTWGETPPYRALALAACEACAEAAPVKQGRAGAGFGAQAGGARGGLGSASCRTASGVTVAALVAVNSFGSVRMAGCDAFWAWPFEIDGEFGGARPPASWRAGDHLLDSGLPSDTKLSAPPRRAGPGANTTIGVVATSAPLTQADARRLAIMAQDGVARAIRPVHGPTDGDIVFALSAPREDNGSPKSRVSRESRLSPIDLSALGSLAADCMARAIARAVHEADKS